MLTTIDIEVAVAKHLNYRQHLIVPNVFWGMGFNHELDLAVITKARYLWEVEIKVSKSDLKADLLKRHQHFNILISRLYFAIPEALLDFMELIPERAGIFVVSAAPPLYKNWPKISVKEVRKAKINKSAKPLNEKQMQKMYHLAAMRIWRLKEKLQGAGGV